MRSHLFGHAACVWYDAPLLARTATDSLWKIMANSNSFGADASLVTSSGTFSYVSLPKLAAAGFGGIETLPFSIRVLLEACLRNCDGFLVSEDDVKNVANWNATKTRRGRDSVSSRPRRAAGLHGRAGRRRSGRIAGGDGPHGWRPRQDQSAGPLRSGDRPQRAGRSSSRRRIALQFNVDKEFERNQERYQFLKWGQQAFENFRVIPPATGIVHQVNLEYLATVATDQGSRTAARSPIPTASSAPTATRR